MGEVGSDWGALERGRSGREPLQPGREKRGGGWRPLWERRGEASFGGGGGGRVGSWGGGTGSLRVPLVEEGGELSGKRRWAGRASLGEN